MKTTKSAIIVLSLCLIVLLSACQTGNQDSRQESIKVGASLPLTGLLSYKGIPVKNAMQMAVDEINEAGGVNNKNLEISYEDNKSRPQEATHGANRLIGIGGVNVLLSLFTSLSSAIAPVTQSKNKILVYQSTIPNIADQNKYTFRDYYSMEDVADKFSRTIMSEKLNKVSIVYINSDWANIFYDSFKQKLDRDNIETVYSQAVNQDTKDFRSELLKIKESRAEVVVYMGFYKDVNLILKQIAEMKLDNLRLFVLEGPHPDITNNETSKQVLAKMRAFGNFHYYNPNSPEPKVRKFVTGYQEEFGQMPDANAAYFYDDIYVLAQVLEECDNQRRIDDTDCLANELLKVKDYQGVAGPLSFDENGNAEREQKLFEFAEGEWVEYVLE